MIYCLYCCTFDHDGATCAKRLKALAEHEADWNAWAAERQAFYESLPVDDSKPRGQSSTAFFRFRTPESRDAYFAELAAARADVEPSKSPFPPTMEPAWMRPMGADERIHNRKITED